MRLRRQRDTFGAALYASLIFCRLISCRCLLVVYAAAAARVVVVQILAVSIAALLRRITALIIVSVGTREREREWSSVFSHSSWQ